MKYETINDLEERINKLENEITGLYFTEAFICFLVLALSLLNR